MFITATESKLRQNFVNFLSYETTSFGRRGSLNKEELLKKPKLSREKEFGRRVLRCRTQTH